jgi:hypothetical protein
MSRVGDGLRQALHSQVFGIVLLHQPRDDLRLGEWAEWHVGLHDRCDFGSARFRVYETFVYRLKVCLGIGVDVDVGACLLMLCFGAE